MFPNTRRGAKSSARRSSILPRLLVGLALVTVATVPGTAPAWAQAGPGKNEVSLRLDLVNPDLKLEKIEDFKAGPNNDGTIKVRLRLTRYVVILPDSAIVNYDAPATLLKSGPISGTALSEGPILGRRRNERTFEIETPQTERTKLYNLIRAAVPRKQQAVTLLGGKDPGADGVSEISKASLILGITAPDVFAFGDQEYTVATALTVAEKGTEDSIFIPDALAPALVGVKVLTDPAKATDAKAAKEDANLTTLKKYARYEVESVEGQYKAGAGPISKVRFISVRIVWVLEANLDPKKEKQFQLSSKFGELTADSASGTEVAAKPKPDTNAPNAQTSFLSLILGPQTLDPNGVPAARPGLEPVIGFTVNGAGNRPRSAIGVNFYPPGYVTDKSLENHLFDWKQVGKRLGILVAGEQNGGGSIIAGFTYRTTPQLMLYAGPVYGRGSERSRGALTFGAMFSISPLLGQKPATDAGDGGGSVKVTVTSPDLLKVSPLGQTQTALVFTVVDDGMPPAGSDALDKPLTGKRLVPLAEGIATLAGETKKYDVGPRPPGPSIHVPVSIRLMPGGTVPKTPNVQIARNQQLTWILWIQPGKFDSIGVTVANKTEVMIPVVDANNQPGVTVKAGEGYRLELNITDRTKPKATMIPLKTP